MVKPQLLVEPLRTPPLPTEARSLPGTHQMAPNLRRYPVSDKRKAFARIADGKVIHPTAKDRIDLLHHPLHRLADILSEDFLQLCQQAVERLEGVTPSVTAVPKPTLRVPQSIQ